MSADHPPLARALGRLPSGLFIVTTLGPDGPLGFLGSFVQQFDLDPPTVAVGVGAGRDHLEAMRGSGRFAISVLDDEGKGLMPPFFGKVPEGQTAFDVVAWSPAPGGTPVLDGALAWIEAEVTGEHALDQHVVVFGRATAGEQRRDGDPLIHLRKNGFSY